MEIHKIKKDRNYTVINNEFLWNKKMSLKAKGLLTFIMSLPPDWDFSIAGMIAILKEGRESIRNTTKELIRFGHCTHEQYNGKNGHIEHVYTWYEKPLTVQPATGNPSTVNPSPENHNQLSTNLKSTNLKSTNLKSTNLKSTKDKRERVFVNPEIEDNKPKTPKEANAAFTAPKNLFTTFCAKHDFARVGAWPAPLSDVNYHKLTRKYGEDVFRAQIEKINNEYKRNAKDCNRTILNWFKKYDEIHKSAKHENDTTRSMCRMFQEKYTAHNGVKPSVTKYDAEHFAGIAEQLEAMNPVTGIVEAWRTWLDAFFAMKEKKGFTWKTQLPKTLNAKFSLITSGMKIAIHEQVKTSLSQKRVEDMTDEEVEIYLKSFK